MGLVFHTLILSWSLLLSTLESSENMSPVTELFAIFVSSESGTRTGIFIDDFNFGKL